eukprot:symbB.v1.2.006919.t1/scaffold417.1/size208627/7
MGRKRGGEGGGDGDAPAPSELWILPPWVSLLLQVILALVLLVLPPFHLTWACQVLPEHLAHTHQVVCLQVVCLLACRHGRVSHQVALDHLDCLLAWPDCSCLQDCNYLQVLTPKLVEVCLV